MIPSSNRFSMNQRKAKVSRFSLIKCSVLSNNFTISWKKLKKTAFVLTCQIISIILKWTKWSTMKDWMQFWRNKFKLQGWKINLWSSICEQGSIHWIRSPFNLNSGSTIWVTLLEYALLLSFWRTKIWWNRPNYCQISSIRLTWWCPSQWSRE